jgi:hypothetical protein
MQAHLSGGSLRDHLGNSVGEFLRDPNARIAARTLQSDPAYASASDGALAAEIGVRLILDPAVAAREAAIGLLAAGGCRKSAYHPQGDPRRSWKSLAANAELGGAAA